LLLSNISEQASITFRSLEGLTTFAQREGLLKLYSNYANLFEAIGPLHLNEIIDENSYVLSTDRKFAINVENTLRVMED
jgi:dimeric dUTPase (all-alpha-NTP-PPase superfamily)